MKKPSVVVLLAIIFSVAGGRAWSRDPSGIPDRDFTLWGTGYVDDLALTRDDAEYTISLQVDGVELASYVMGDRSANQDWYVLRVPMSAGERAGYAQPGDAAQIYINGVSVITAYLEPVHQPVTLPIIVGDAAETIRMDIYAQIPPGAIDDLSASGGASNGEVDLTWTAPGNNGALGTVAGYIVKYSQDPITSQTEFDSADTFPQSWTPKPPGEMESHTVTGLIAGETYYFAVEAIDDVPIQASMSNSPVSAVARAGMPPVASALTIEPGEPKTEDDLVGDYTYSDPEGHPESGLTEIKWYRDNILRTDYSNTLTIPSDATLKEQEWYFTVKPHNGFIFGALRTSSPVVIGNTRPVVSDSVISPSSPLTDDDLTAKYKYSDADGDPEDGTTIRWYKNGSMQSAYNDQEILPAAATSGGQQWRFTVRPGDGTELGKYQTSPTVTIGNSAPVADAGGPYEAVIGEEIIFDGSGSFDPDGDSPMTYLWDFGDDATGSGENPTHTYANEGIYTVTLTVGDGSADSDRSATMAYISNAPKRVQQVAAELEIGWNLISISVRPADMSVGQALSSIDGKYDAVWTYNAGSGEWQRYDLSSPPFLSNLEEV